MTVLKTETEVVEIRKKEWAIARKTHSEIVREECCDKCTVPICEECHVDMAVRRILSSKR